MTSLELLTQLVSIPSVFPNEKNMSKYVSNFLKDLGFVIKKVPTRKDRMNVVATYGKSKTYLGFYGHLDTVAPDTAYTREPFVVQSDGDVARGLGVADMKGGITAILQLATFAVKEKLTVKIIFGVDEENISEGAHDLVDSGMLSSLDFLVVAESGQIKNHHQPFSVCYGRRGRIAFEISVSGKPAHAGEREKGINAVEQMARFISELKNVQFPENPSFGKTYLVTHSIQGATDSFSVPDHCSCVISALTAPPIRHADVLQKLEQLASRLEIAVEIKPLGRKTPFAESYEVDRENSFLNRIENQIFQDKHIEPIYTQSVADENIFANRLGIPVITVGPIGGGDHTADEWVSLRSIDDVIKCYQNMLESYHRSS